MLSIYTVIEKLRRESWRQSFRRTGVDMSVNKKGFSILEVVIGVAIFMVGMLGIAALQISAIKAESFSSRLTEATCLARSTFEQMMSTSYTSSMLEDDDNSGSGKDFAADPGMTTDKNADANANDILDVIEIADEAVIVNGGTNGMYSVYLSVCNECNLEETKTVRVLVTWVVKGVPQTIEFFGMIPRK